MESNTQPEEVTSVNTEINTLTDKLEQPPTENATGPIKDVTTFWTRLDSLLTNIEENETNKKKPAFHSFNNQPERVNISSDNDITTIQSQNNISEQTFSSFKVNIARPFLEVKSIQLLRASIPNAVTNIPDEECTFWYYRLPLKTFGGTISMNIVGVDAYTNATFTKEGVITPPYGSFGILNVYPSSPNAGLVKYQVTSLSGLSIGSTVTISGITPAGYNGTFTVAGIQVITSSFHVVNATTGSPYLPAATYRQVITDYIDFSTIPYTVSSSAGIARGYFIPPGTITTNQTIYPSWTKQAGFFGTPVGTLTRLTDLYIPAPSNQYLKMIRLLPSYYKAELFEPNLGQDDDQPPASTYGYNRTFTDYQDLATELANSCAADPSYDSNLHNGDAFPLFEPDDISITYNSTLNKFIFTGKNDYEFNTSTQLATYLSAGYEDPILWEAIDPDYNPINAYSLQLFTKASCSGYGDFPLIAGINGQPYKINKTLNLRLGFTWNGLYTDSFFPINATQLVSNTARATSVFIAFINRLRPIPEYFFVDTPASIVRGNGPYGNVEYTADNYANLVYTNTVSLYADFTGASTYDSMTNTQLLACVPMNASNLGVAFYNTSLYCPLTKISDQIYEIEIRMLTDTGSPYVIPNSCVVSLELALTY